MDDSWESNSNPPWTELLDSLIEVIIEKLPLLDYIRFGATCKRWHSIQKEHRLLYSPKPPPIAPLVVLANHNICSPNQLTLHLPFKENKFCLPLPYFKYEPIIDSYCGWILTYHLTYRSSLDYFRICNPVTGVIVQLPQFPIQLYDTNASGSISAPPTDPNCCVIIATSSNVFLLRLRDLVWLEVEGTGSLNSSLLFNRYVYVNGKFYGTSEFTQGSLCIVDPFLLNPVEKILEFDTEKISEYDGNLRMLVAIDGELFMVIYICHGHTVKRFHVFRANLTTKKWVRMKSIGDFAILISHKAIGLPVNGFEGFKKNMIYFSQAVKVGPGKPVLRTAWMTFDIASEEVTREPSLLHNKDDYLVSRHRRIFWFFPHL